MLSFEVIAENTNALLAKNDVKIYPDITNIVVPPKGTCFKNSDTIELKFTLNDCDKLPEKISIGALSKYEEHGSTYHGSGGIVFNLNSETLTYELDYSYDTFKNAKLTYTKDYEFTMQSELTNEYNTLEAGFHSIIVFHDDWKEVVISESIDASYIVNDNCAIGKHTITNKSKFVVGEDGSKSTNCVICGN